jgi:hypothetical protein
VVFVRALLSLIVVFVPFAIVLAISQLFFNGLPDASGILLPLSITQRWAEAVIAGLFGLFGAVFSGQRAISTDYVVTIRSRR